MLLIYGKGLVGQGLQHLCKTLGIASQIIDDHDDTTVWSARADQATRIAISPGVPPTHHIYDKYPNKTYSELNRIRLIMSSYSRRQKSIKIAITGTKGKSTTTRITYHLATELMPTSTVHITGNFKQPLGDTLATIMTQGETDRQHIFVIEASSFMLYHLAGRQFDYSIWTNFSPDHLNRHTDLADYFSAKSSIISHTSQVCLTNESIIRQRNSIDGQTSCLLECYTAYNDIKDTQFLGQHNAYNLGASIQLIEHLLMSSSIEVTTSQRQSTIAAIPPLEHRLQLYTHIDGIAIYDDNNSTNSASLETALRSFDHPVILICGGSDKGDSFEHLAAIFTSHVAHVCLIGFMSDIFAQLCERAEVSYTRCENLEPAIHEAFSQAKTKKADTILFSPGCASFDQYTNYHKRAEDFERIIDTIVT